MPFIGDDFYVSFQDKKYSFGLSILVNWMSQTVEQIIGYIIGYIIRLDKSLVKIQVEECLWIGQRKVRYDKMTVSSC